MGAISTHKKYLMNLKKKRNNPLYMNMANKKIRAASGAYAASLDNMKEIYGREGMPVNAVQEAMQKTTGEYVGNIEGIYDQAQGQEEQRRYQLEGQIDQGEDKLGELEAAKRRRDREKKNAMWKGGLSVVAGAANFIPGVGPIISGAINTGSSFIGGADIQGIQQGIMETVGAYTSLKATNLNKQVGGKIMEVVENYDKLPDNEADEITRAFNMLGKDPENLLQYLNTKDFSVWDEPQRDLGGGLPVNSDIRQPGQMSMPSVSDTGPESRWTPNAGGYSDYLPDMSAKTPPAAPTPKLRALNSDIQLKWGTLSDSKKKRYSKLLSQSWYGKEGELEQLLKGIINGS